MDGPARRSEPAPEYFRIGEVARVLSTTPSAIRFYLRRFHPYIRPTRSKTHRQLFSRRDVQVLKVILILRRDFGLSVRDTLERLQDLLVTHQRDPFAIERELVRSKGEADPVADQGELPLGSPVALSDGLREPSPDISALEQQLDEIRRALDMRERELSEARRTAEDLSARIRDLERSVRRLETERNALRLRIGQAVRELLLEVAPETDPEEA